MSAPRLEIRLDRIEQNAAALVTELAARAIGVTGVTKATLGSPEIAAAMVRAGVARIGDSRIENIEAMRRAGVTAPMTLLRGPMVSQAERVVGAADVSLNSELAVISALGAAAEAQGRRHGIVLMVELGDLREGILPAGLGAVVASTLRFPCLSLLGIGTNLACQSGVTPDEANMGELSALARSTEATFGIDLAIVSGGNSANLDWATSGTDVGRVNDLRLGESILLGREPLHRRAIDGLHTDAFTLVAEVIESKTKPTAARGTLGETTFGRRAAAADRGDITRVLLAIGRQDVDPEGLQPPDGLGVLGWSSDHLVLDAGAVDVAVGSEVRFQLGYGALLAAMTSPYVSREYLTGPGPSPPGG